MNLNSEFCTVVVGALANDLNYLTLIDLMVRHQGNKQVSYVLVCVRVCVWCMCGAIDRLNGFNWLHPKVLSGIKRSQTLPDCM